MSIAVVTEARLRLEPVTADPFITGLDGGMQSAADRLGRRCAAAPRRRIFD